MNISDLQHELLDAGLDGLSAPETFAACLNAKGLYNSLQFVLRLSPRVHQLVDSIPSGTYDASTLSGEVVQAYSTYLHETVHWWQHVGSTSGMVLSLCYPALTHMSMEELRNVLTAVGPKKSLFKWAEGQLLAGVPSLDPVLSQANTAVNNAIDTELYKTYTLLPKMAEEIYAHQYFESVGHCYHIAYAHMLSVLDEFDPSKEHLPEPANWASAFGKLSSDEHMGFYVGSPIRRPPVGLKAIFEGQARFIQLQYLTINSQITCDELQTAGYFNGIYVEAFEQFLQITKSEWPKSIDSPQVGLFLLICDLAINPTRGFPFNITSFEDFILDVEPGTRFARLCYAVSESHPELRTAIKDYSFEEYVDVSGILCKAAGYDHPMAALEEISEWPAKLSKVADVMTERETFRYKRTNLPIRVMFSHFIGFCTDKYANPEFFCWTGAWMTGERASERSTKLFLTHLSLYSDKADDDGIFARNFPGKDPEGILATFNAFYTANMMYDLTKQWILEDGPFEYDFSWLTHRISNEVMAEAGKKVFAGIFGRHPDDFEIL